MNKALLVALSVLLAGISSLAIAQDNRDIVGTWRLSAVEHVAEGADGERIGGSRGVLIIDGAGYVFEFFSTTSRNEPEVSPTDPQRTLQSFGGFWGRYVLDAGEGRIDFESVGGVSPSVHGLSFSRRYELTGDRLVVTSGDEPQAQGDKRWIWERMPIVENLSEAYREVVGFWEHVEEYRADTTTGEISNRNRRAPSVIVYTPSGFVGVHFPTLGRDSFVDPADPTDDEARAAVRGYLGYFGTLGVYPGEVSHNLLSGISPGTGSILRRYAEIEDDVLTVTLQGGGAALPVVEPRSVTKVVLRRLSGADDMLR